MIFLVLGFGTLFVGAFTHNLFLDTLSCVTFLFAFLDIHLNKIEDKINEIKKKLNQKENK